ncbi:hypothetical protein SAMN05446935_9330 [Burkholderia sp. YR290]|jgi:hypothetical protein|uniref:Uncharacterized protein n=1 Tax=Paraburkholderia hospita TaxID=169430 RepID=A0AAN1MQ84_9BURK|nr:hypothetical protein C2L64_44020 [Paraburkholderia hospita]SKC96489.1 hypothetical protein SAMN05445504_6920 [Burkholderia sp. CF099]SOE90051.1 hypothetical protein SAMN05446935_9330 [Burkholderia sp. YR290]EIM93205.1 hypothetical protein WQE_50535 [Paraburkholderia hospita]OUL90280.1 hypothetical protein CA601_15790 [Paraburkholderia hospita]
MRFTMVSGLRDRSPSCARTSVTSVAVCAVTHIAALSAHLLAFNICDGEGQLNSFAAMPPIARRYNARECIHRALALICGAVSPILFGFA